MSRFPIHQPLGSGGGLTADHANGLKLIRFFSNGQQDWHTAKWLSAKIRIQAGHKNTDALICQFFDNRDNFRVEELGFIRHVIVQPMADPVGL